MPYKYNRLRGRIVEKYGSQASFARKLGISATQLSRKMSGKVGFSQADMLEWGELLQIPKEEFVSYFFA